MSLPRWMDRFWSKVDQAGPNDCWEWTGGKFSNGYGSFWLEGKSELAHRIAFFMLHGYQPTPVCRHTCDNPGCCNPRHLREGTHQDNVDDRTNRFRAASGTRNGNAKLPDADVEAIRRRYSTTTITQAELAKAYGITQPYVSKLVLGINRKEHV